MRKSGFIFWLKELFEDERGHVSIKPVIALIGALFLCGIMVVNAFSNESIKLSDTLINAIMIITSIGMGADSVDKFSHKKPTPQEREDDGGWGVPKKGNDRPREDADI